MFDARRLHQAESVNLVFLCFRMSRKRPLGEKNIIFALNDGTDSEDGLDFDDDSLADPDFVPELETIEDTNPEIDIDVDSIIETLENNDEIPSSSKESEPKNSF